MVMDGVVIKLAVMNCYYIKKWMLELQEFLLLRLFEFIPLPRLLKRRGALHTFKRSRSFFSIACAPIYSKLKTGLRTLVIVFVELGLVTKQ